MPKNFAVHWSLLLLIFFSPWAAHSAEKGPSLIVGIAELEVRGKYAGEPRYNRLRPLFIKGADGWRPLYWTADSPAKDFVKDPSPPKDMTWHFASPGLENKGWEAGWKKSGYYSERGYYSLSPEGLKLFPKVTEGTEKYFTWEETNPSFRPSLVSNKSCEAGLWKEAVAEKILVRAAITTFKGMKSGQTFDLQKKPGKIEKVEFSSLSERDVRVDWCYQDGKGQSLLLLGPAQGMYALDDGDMAEEAFGCTVFRCAKGQCEPTGVEGIPVGVADLDQDGHVEWLFSISGYNYQEYQLFDDAMNKMASIHWSFH